MDKKVATYLKTGFFVVTTTVLFIIALYKLAGKRSMFNSTVRITAVFKNVNGLLPGNNVRFGGIDIGTVSKVSILSDTAIEAELDIQKAPFVHVSSTSIASIGTDGLMGNKIVNIIPGKAVGIPMKEGGSIQVLPLVEMDNAIRTLNKTNDNLEQITDDVKLITNRFSAKNTLWSILMDTAISDNLKNTLVDIRSSGRNVKVFSQGLAEMIGNVNQGKGNLGILLNDTSLAGNLRRALIDLRVSGRQTAVLTADLNRISAKLVKGEGSIGALMEDTALVHHIDQAVIDFKKGAANFDSSMVALKHNYLLRGYFKKKKKSKDIKKTD
jgi:phospholipid/cholesterol/gamma-HCH transport system substrate-binding protein